MAWGQIDATLDYLCGVAVRVQPRQGRLASTATLKLYASGEAEPMRESVRSTLDCAPGSWLLFPFDSIRESAGRDYWFSVETDAEDEAIALAAGPGGGVEGQARYSPRLARLLDPLLSRSGQVLPPVPERLERYLDRHVYQCVNLRRYFFLRLVHLCDALGRIPEPIAEVLSIGAGVCYQEEFIAGRLPDLRVTATDLEPTRVEFPMPNLHFERLDLLAPPWSRRFDLVFSIECLEHIEDFRAAFRHQATMVKPGGYLYVSVPFASREEQRDPQLRRAAWEGFQHYTPGFSFEDLDELFAENGVAVLHASNMFHLDVVLPLRSIVEKMTPGELECGVGEIAALFLLDVDRERVASCRQAEGIRFLGYKPRGAGDLPGRPA